MFDDTAALFYENVLATFEGYLDVKASGTLGKSRDLRTALAAATAAYHFREHLPITYAKSRSDIVRQCPDYSLLGDVVNAGKHNHLTKGLPKLTSADQIEERIVNTEYEDEQGVYRHVEKRVILKPPGHPERDLLDVLINVVNFWQDELVGLGVIPKRARYKLPDDPQPRPRAECNGGRIDFEVIQGVRFKTIDQFQRFNYKTSRVEPVDLSGAELQFRVFKQLYSVDVVLTNNATNQKLTRTLLLDEQESQGLAKCRSEKEFDEFLKRLPKAQDAIRELEGEVRRLEATPMAEQQTDSCSGT